MQMNLDEYITLLKNKDKNAWNDLSDKYRTRFLHYVMKKGASPLDAEDAVSRGMVNVHKKCPDIPPTTFPQFLGYVARSCKNAWITEIRKHHPGTVPITIENKGCIENIADNSNEDITIRLDILKMMRCIENLHESHRIVINLRELQEMTWEKIAILIEGDSSQAAQSRVRRSHDKGMVLLGKCMGKAYK